MNNVLQFLIWLRFKSSPILDSSNYRYTQYFHTHNFKWVFEIFLFSVFSVLSVNPNISNFDPKVNQRVAMEKTVNNFITTTFGNNNIENWPTFELKFDALEFSLIYLKIWIWNSKTFHSSNNQLIMLILLKYIYCKRVIFPLISAIYVNKFLCKFLISQLIWCWRNGRCSFWRRQRPFWGENWASERR